MSLAGVADSFELDGGECSIYNQLRIEVWTVGYWRRYYGSHRGSFDEWGWVIDAAS